MRVFVLNMRGESLSPCSVAKARFLLKEKKAEVARRTPFTIRLTTAGGQTTQPVRLNDEATASVNTGSAAAEAQAERELETDLNPEPDDTVVLADWVPMTDRFPAKAGLYVVTFINRKGKATSKYAFWELRTKRWHLFCRPAGSGREITPTCSTVVAWHEMPLDDHFAVGPGDWGWVVHRNPTVRTGAFLVVVRSEATRAEALHDEDTLSETEMEPKRDDRLYEGRWLKGGWRHDIVVEKWLKAVAPYAVAGGKYEVDIPKFAWRLRSVVQNAPRDDFIVALEKNINAACRETKEFDSSLHIPQNKYLPGGAVVPAAALRRIALQKVGWVWFEYAEPVCGKLLAVEFLCEGERLRRIMRFNGGVFVEDNGETLNPETVSTIRWRYWE